MSQFAVASGGMAYDADRELPHRVLPTPQSRLIQMVKFGEVDDRALAAEVLKISFKDTDGPDAFPGERGEPHPAARTNEPERFAYPSAPSAPSGPR